MKFNLIGVVIVITNKINNITEIYKFSKKVIYQFSNWNLSLNTTNVYRKISTNKYF